jgi:hypothetical protein
VGPSAIRYEGKVYTPAFQPMDPEIPRALETTEIKSLIKTFIQAAKNAMAAGFDGIEWHGVALRTLAPWVTDLILPFERQQRFEHASLKPCVNSQPRVHAPDSRQSSLTMLEVTWTSENSTMRNSTLMQSTCEL